MAQFDKLLVFGQYLLLIVPSIAVMAFARWIGSDRRGPQASLKLLLLTTALALVVLGLLIWFNPYGREISSSLPAFGMLPVAVALLVLTIRKSEAAVGLWYTDRLVLVILAVAILLSAGFVLLAQPLTFYLVIGLTTVLLLAWLIGTRLGPALLVLAGLLLLPLLIVTTGGVFYSSTIENTPGLWTAMKIVQGLATVLAIFLAAAVLYSSLSGKAGSDSQKLGMRPLVLLILAALLAIGSAYPTFWDGVWSAAHERAFEDHLPFTHFMVSLMAGVLLALSLRGWRRLAGPGFSVLVTTAATLALISGWDVSAFDLTEHRAVRINQALIRYYEDNGRYPTDLQELAPGYLLYLPASVVVRQGGWCYQGGEEYYRLGYVSGAFTYFTSDFHSELFAKAGNKPGQSWECDRLVAEYQAGTRAP